MTAIQNVLGISALIILFLVITLAGLARERRIDRELRAAEAPPVPVPRRPYIRSWARF
ncbi:hypothetical protein ACFVWY_29040 [Streptomyces sp. NPDC058195]|uniref:hypothetical protein n=1 Tax=Streptomyces sp. NPDC058195 TaxID=3346375 RepID=UPI0036EBF81F